MPFQQLALQCREALRDLASTVATLVAHVDPTTLRLREVLADALQQSVTPTDACWRWTSASVQP